MKETQILSEKTQNEVGNQYNGYISGKSEKGYFVRFFNEVTGFLPLADYSYKMGQTVKLYVAYVSKKTGNLGLS